MFVNKVKVFTIVGIFSFLFVANAEWVFENNTVTDGNWILSAKYVNL